MATEEVSMPYARGAVERAMKVQEVILRALAGKLTWIEAAELLGRSARSIRRLRLAYERVGCDALFDRRRQVPSPKRAPVAELQRVLALYRDRYEGFNVRHFHQIARRDHGVTFCYAFVKKALQAAGLVARQKARGRHRRRREPRPCFGELLHLDGSRHQWLALAPETWFSLIAVVDDATKQLLYAELHDSGESVAVIMTALRAVLETYGVPMALYTDRAHWAVHTPTSGSAPDRRRPTQVGRALAQLGIEHILGYSPQARGRSERVNRTLQGRLINELRLAGIRTVPAANRYLRERFLPAFNAEFGRRCRPPAPRWSAFRVVRRSLPRPLRSPRPPTPGGVMSRPQPERSFHGVKQLRPDHGSTTATPLGLQQAVHEHAAKLTVDGEPVTQDAELLGEAEPRRELS
jgi:hypothetical protein